MTTRPSLLRNIPFWVLFIGSLLLTALGAWIVFDRLGTLDGALRGQVADQIEASVSVYVGQPAAVVGGIVLGAGLIGLLLTLALAVARSFVPDSTEVIETIDWSSDDESTPSFASSGSAPAAASTLDEVIGQDPDVERSTTPERGDDLTHVHDEPNIATNPAGTAPAVDAEPSASNPETHDDDTRR